MRPRVPHGLLPNLVTGVGRSPNITNNFVICSTFHICSHVLILPLLLWRNENVFF
ncbi:13475_t:CDS:2 [Gigaspora rosea]|nr:13475_t:CDS:2 [Gigaspora rosea]